MSINRKIIIVVLNLLLIIDIILISLPIREELIAYTNELQTGEYVNFGEIPNLSLEVIEPEVLNYVPMKDADAIKQTPTKVKLTNDTDEKQNYKLQLKFARNSTVKSSWLKTSVNGKTYNLNDLLAGETSEFKYYTIDENTLNVNENKEYDIILWIKSSVGEDALGTSFNVFYEVN